MSNWQYLAGGYGVPTSGTTTTGGGGGGVNLLAGYRSIMDARRSAADPARTPQAEYPDGYLGNVNDRRQDRLLKGVQSRLTQRNYQRGVHKGERIDPSDYYWSGDVTMTAALEAEAKGLKWTQVGSTPAEQLTRLGENHMLSDDQYTRLVNRLGLSGDIPQTVNQARAAQTARLRPRWR